MCDSFKNYISERQVCDTITTRRADDSLMGFSGLTVQELATGLRLDDVALVAGYRLAGKLQLVDRGFPDPEGVSVYRDELGLFPFPRQHDFICVRHLGGFYSTRHPNPKSIPLNIEGYCGLLGKYKEKAGNAFHRAVLRTEYAACFTPPLPPARPYLVGARSGFCTG